MAKATDDLVTSRAASLAEQIRQRVLTEALPDGTLFSTEAQLAQEYGVSRNVAREAAGRLKALGILESRRRKGLVVRRPDPARLLSHGLPSLADSDERLRDLARLRYVIEVGAIELAVQNATAEQIQRLEALAMEFEQAIKSLADCRMELELKFHGLILEMTGSSLIARMQQVLAEYFHQRGRIVPLVPAQEIIWQHNALVSAIRDRDVERARSMMRLHFRVLLEPTDGATETARNSMPAGK